MKSEERKKLVQYKILKARETFNEVQILIENKLWNTAINRLYYSCFYAVISLLVDKEIYTQTHAGVRQMFGFHFIKSGIISKEQGQFFTDIFDMRQTGDYDDYIEFEKEDVLDLIEPANNLISRIEQLINE
jgi:uncharacterized protein (UPF0332 family)